MKQHLPSIKVILFSALWILYALLAVIPFAEAQGFFSESSVPTLGYRLLYLAITLPVFAVYLWYVLSALKKIDFLRCIVYPLMALNVYCGFFLCLLYYGGTILWFMVFSFLLPAVAIPALFILGLVKDIKQWYNT